MSVLSKVQRGTFWKTPGHFLEQNTGYYLSFTRYPLCMVGNTLYVELRFPPFIKRSPIRSAIPRQMALMLRTHIKEINQASNAGISTKQSSIRHFHLTFSVEYSGVLPEKPITVN